MVRPCFLVVDQEFVGNISTRKLVIETAKFNVLTAYSSDEAVELLRLYPAVSGVVLDARMPDMPCDELVRRLKKLDARMPVIAVAAPGSPFCAGADYHLNSFDPRRLLECLENLEPKATEEIERRNEELDLSDRS